MTDKPSSKDRVVFVGVLTVGLGAAMALGIWNVFNVLKIRGR